MNRPALTRLSVVAALALFLTGCISTNRTALAPAGLEKIKSVHVTAMVSQPEIAADIVPSNLSAATGGGLIAALIDSAVDAHRAKKTEGTITPLRDAMVGYDVSEALRQALAEELLPEAPLPMKAVIVSLQMKPAALKEAAHQATTDAVLFVAIDYHLTAGFDRVRVAAKVTLLPAKDTPEGKALYVNELGTYADLPASAVGANNLARWADNHGAALREGLATCFAELADMIEFDLQQGTEANLPARATWDRQAPAVGRMGTMQGINMRGVAAHQYGDRTWVRLPTGELSSTL